MAARTQNVRLIGIPRRRSPASASIRRAAHRMLRQQSATAFSLVELVIALAILSIGLVGAMRVFPVGLRASERAEVNSRAVMAGQRAIESLKLLSWDELAIADTTVEDDDFTITTSITELNLDDLVDTGRLKAIEVIIQSTRSGRTRELEFVTYVRRSDE